MFFSVTTNTPAIPSDGWFNSHAVPMSVPATSGSSQVISCTRSPFSLSKAVAVLSASVSLSIVSPLRMFSIIPELPDVAGTDIGTAWEVNQPTLGITGVFVVTEKNISDYVNNFYVKLKLKNKGFSSEYGKVFKKDEKKVRPETKVYNTLTLNDTIRRVTEDYDIYQPVTIFPAVDGAFAGMSYPAIDTMYPS